MSAWTIFFTALGVGFSGAIMPGPLLTVTISQTVKRGFIAGPLLILGHAILELLLVVGLVLGLDAVLANEVVAGAMKLVGGAVLLWMAWGITKSLRHATLDLSASDTETVLRGGIVVSGAIVSLSNPYWAMWWATIGLGYVTVALDSSRAGIVWFLSGHIMADMLWYSLVAYVVSAGRRLFGQGIYRTTLGICSAFLLLLGAQFVYLGILTYV